MIKITFGIIVLNGEPFTRYNLRALYPYAHQIIIVEGASPNASYACRSDGHSHDGTLEILREFKEKHDPQHKILIVTAEDDGYLNGFWPGEKDEQSKAYAKRATGEYLWQVDIDEFYKTEDIERIIRMLEEDSSITAITFPEIPFWGSFDFRCDGPYLRMNYSKFHRLFKWGTKYEMVTHRPPTVVDDQGRNLRTIRWVNSQEMAKKGIYLYHYTQIFPGQVRNKMHYYAKLIKVYNWQHITNVNGWLEHSYFQLKDPFHVHTVNTQTSWLLRYEGSHPEPILELIQNIKDNKIVVELRDVHDVYDLVDSFAYQFVIKILELWTNYITQTLDLCKDYLKKRRSFVNVLETFRLIMLRKQKVF